MKTKIKIFFLFIYTLYLIPYTFSQDIIFDWKHIIGNGTSQNEGKCIATDSAGYVYVGGIITGTLTFLDTTVNATGTYESFVAKLTPAGNFVWFKWFRSSFCRIESICIDRENKLYVTGIYGNSVSFDTIIHSNNADSASITNMFIAKFDTSGALLWAKNTQGVDYVSGDGSGPLKKLTVDNDNNLIVTGRCIDNLQYFDTTATVPVSSPETGFLVKYNSSGQKLWVKKIGGASCYPYAVKTDNSDNILVTGSYSGINYFDTISITTTFNANVFLAKFQPIGNVIWAKGDGGDAALNGYDIGIDIFNNIFFVGRMHGNNIKFEGQLLYQWSSGEGFIAKYTNSGIFQWVVPIGTSHVNTSTNTNNKCFSIRIMSDTIYLLGSFMDTLTYGNVTLQSDGKYETFLLKMDLNGNVLEAGQYIAHMFTYPQELAIDNNNNIYIVGFQSNKILIGKIQTLFPVNAIETQISSNNFMVFPNPNNGNFFVESENSNLENYMMSVFDITGKLIAIYTIDNIKMRYDLSYLQKGIYFLKISNKSENNIFKIIID